ncbi:MAG: Dipeptide transport system permease protein DppC, partial [uncultured Acidimicrobiales bacterium]
DGDDDGHPGRPRGRRRGASSRARTGEPHLAGAAPGPHGDAGRGAGRVPRGRRLVGAADRPSRPERGRRGQEVPAALGRVPAGKRQPGPRHPLPLAHGRPAVDRDGGGRRAGHRPARARHGDAGRLVRGRRGRGDQPGGRHPSRVPAVPAGSGDHRPHRSRPAQPHDRPGVGGLGRLRPHRPVCGAGRTEQALRRGGPGGGGERAAGARQARAPQRGGARAGPHHPRHGRGPPRRLRALLPRPRRQATHPRVGLHAGRGPQLPRPGPADDHLPGRRHLPHGPGLQPAGRRPPRRPRPPLHPGADKGL